MRRLGDPSLNRLGIKTVPWGLGRSGGFLPINISGLLLWLAADLGLSLSDGDPVALWPDQSGNGNDASQAAGAKQPTFRTNIIGGKPIVRSDGVADSMDLTGLTAAVGNKTFFAVVDPTVVATKYIFDTQTGRLIVTTNSNAARLGWFDGAAWKETTLTVAEPQIVVWVLDSAINGEVFKNGASQGVAAYVAQDIGGLTAIFSVNSGTSAFIAADLAEFGIYDNAISVADRQNLEEYLSNKYGIALP